MHKRIHVTAMFLSTYFLCVIIHSLPISYFGDKIYVFHIDEIPPSLFFAIVYLQFTLEFSHTPKQVLEFIISILVFWIHMMYKSSFVTNCFNICPFTHPYQSSYVYTHDLHNDFVFFLLFFLHSSSYPYSPFSIPILLYCLHFLYI